tara:strand:+ start:4015 stop:6075 length:2061 start_codon:yes stop_codon:yes gene_type:complete
MRPLRLLLSLSTCLIALTLLLYVSLGSQQDEELEQNSARGKKKGFKALFSFTSPGSLFPPSAIISLTDDNSTFFLARPAAFGPSLPKDGLSSALWIGSGFGDDAFGNGELGCGDSPDWEDRNDELKVGSQSAPSSLKGADVHKDSSHVQTRRSDQPRPAPTPTPPTYDGTDDHLRTPHADHSSANTHKKQILKHADIQTLQESAEIEGKVVLLKRGGCGFLAKVLWAQKRGAVAVIVGDDVRGGGLIRMYAKGDTSNVTISSIFTSHTTAHLLSSLLPRGARSGLLSGKPTKIETSKAGQSQTKDDPEPYTATTPLVPTFSGSKTAPTAKLSQQDGQTKAAEDAHDGRQGQSWLDSTLAALGFGHEHEGSFTAGIQSPPDANGYKGQENIKTASAVAHPLPMATFGDFVIGKQDWRDPDLMSVSTSTTQNSPASSISVTVETKAHVTPGSGEYSSTAMTDKQREAWWNKWFGQRDETTPLPQVKPKGSRSITSITDANLNKLETISRKPDQHEGLWVTLTPTNVSTSPFFDTLLVLVVSPLVTLTVVYALLLLRSRIRRRRWRAPKSLVERLPVRTYHTISDSSSLATPSAASPTTPLLQHSPPQPSPPTDTPCARADEEDPATSSSTQHDDRTREEEKREHGLAEWRRRYGGRQKECVVCLEEYIDGISQVMSLPCGHEFHAECM